MNTQDEHIVLCPSLPTTLSSNMSAETAMMPAAPATFPRWRAEPEGKVITAQLRGHAGGRGRRSVSGDGEAGGVGRRVGCWMPSIRDCNTSWTLSCSRVWAVCTPHSSRAPHRPKTCRELPIVRFLRGQWEKVAVAGPRRFELPGRTVRS
jgi:hypothetical protein